MSTYGFSNSREVILGEQDNLITENYDRFEVDQIIGHWKKDALQRDILNSKMKED